MGYFTEHTMEIVKGDLGLIEDLLEDCEEARYSIDAVGDCYQESKWYDHKKDLLEFSEKHPDAILKLSGEGEESRDLWVEYYKAGKMQLCKARISFDEFNIDRMK